MKFPKTAFGKRYPESKLGDYVIYDQITGFKIWASEATKLDVYTGKGGLYTHNLVSAKALNIDYGLIPYKIPAETPIPFSTENHTPPNEGTTGMYFDPETDAGLP